MDISELDYELPDSAIAQTPAEPREAARLLRIDRSRGALDDHVFGDLPRLLRPGDCIVVNDSRVIPARVFADDEGGRAVELLFVEPVDGARWRALVRPGRRCGRGVRLRVGGEGGAGLQIVDVEDDGVRIVERLDGPSIDTLLTVQGLPPLPPYIARHTKPGPEDTERYQTVYASAPGSIAAPTAGLHFTEALLARLRARGVEVHAVTLHVGPGTFRPIKAARVEDHQVAGERARVSDETARAVGAARREGRRVVAVGTTATRTLESAAADGEIAPFEGRAALTIHPGYRFRVVDALITNFHLPRSSLLSLVCAFAGRERIMRAYGHAVAAGYRFYSYGDATLIE